MKHSMKPAGMKWVALMTLTLALMLVASQAFAAPVRITVLPFYVQDGNDFSDGGGATEHYRRTLGFITNHLNRDQFMVIDPFARESLEKELDRVMERSREDSALASRELCAKYGVDAVFIVWLKLKAETTSDGYNKVSAYLDGKGYDAGGRDLGMYLAERMKLTRRDREDAIFDVEKWMGDKVGRELTTWYESPNNSIVDYSQGQAVASGSSLKEQIRQKQSYIEVKLEGATNSEEAEVFGKVVNTVAGVVEATRYASNLSPNNPQASFVTWMLEIKDTEPFRLQTNIMKMIDDVVKARGDITLKGVPYRYTAKEVAMLKGIREGKTNARAIQFVIDPDRVIAKERAGGKGFE